MNSPKQSMILAYCRAHADKITLDEAVELVGNQYHNQRKHTGMILGNMVKRGMLARVKRGTYTAQVTAWTLRGGPDVMPAMREWVMKNGGGA